MLPESPRRAEADGPVADRGDAAPPMVQRIAEAEPAAPSGGAVQVPEESGPITVAEFAGADQ